MSEIGGVGGRRHFTADDEAALRRDESTNSIVKRDTKLGVDVQGRDETWAETKHRQHAVSEHAGHLAGEIVVTAIEGGEISGAIHVVEHLAVRIGASEAAAAGTVNTLGVLAPIGAFILGAYELSKAHEEGEEQNAALRRETAHVAVLGALDLPASYKAARLDGEYARVPKGAQSVAYKATEALMADRQGLATLQLHADRGMNAARDCASSGMTAEAFLRANPKVAERYATDAAFHEGFDAYTHVKSEGPAQRKALDAQLDQRDGWYAQSQVQYRL